MGWGPGGRDGVRGPCRGCNCVSICPCFCLHLSLSLTLSLPILVTLCLDLPGWGPAGSEREVVVNMLNSLSRNQPLPQITPRCRCVDPLLGRLPFQGYESTCSGRHYCLRGMDYCITGAPCTERHLRPLCSVQPTVRFAGPRPAQPCPIPKNPVPQSPALPRLLKLQPSPSLTLICLCVRAHPSSSPLWLLTGLCPVPPSWALGPERTTEEEDPVSPEVGSRSA